jgi:hypothetical protein
MRGFRLFRLNCKGTDPRYVTHVIRGNPIPCGKTLSHTLCDFIRLYNSSSQVRGALRRSAQRLRA